MVVILVQDILLLQQVDQEILAQVHLFQVVVLVDVVVLAAVAVAVLGILVQMIGVRVVMAVTVGLVDRAVELLLSTLKILITQGQ